MNYHKTNQLPPMNNLHRILVVAILALATNHAIAVSVPMDKALAEAVASSGEKSPQTLQEAVDASNAKRDNDSSRWGNKRTNNLRMGSQPETTGDNPQTLQQAIDASHAKRDDYDDGNERRNPLSNTHRISDRPDKTLGDAISASNAKRFDVGFGSGSPAVAIIDRDSLGIQGPERPLGVEDADMDQSAIIETSKKTSTEGFFPALRDYAVTFNGRHHRSFAESGSVANRKISAAGWIAATCLFVAQVW